MNPVENELNADIGADVMVRSVGEETGRWCFALIARYRDTANRRWLFPMPAPGVCHSSSVGEREPSYQIGTSATISDTAAGRVDR